MKGVKSLGTTKCTSIREPPAIQYTIVNFSKLQCIIGRPYDSTHLEVFLCLSHLSLLWLPHKFCPRLLPPLLPPSLPHHLTSTLQHCCTLRAVHTHWRLVALKHSVKMYMSSFFFSLPSIPSPSFLFSLPPLLDSSVHPYTTPPHLSPSFSLPPFVPSSLHPFILPFPLSTPS